MIPEHSGVLLTDAMWRSRFHADPHVIGQEIRRGGDSFQIAGVLSSDFRFLTREPALYIVDRSLAGNSMMVVARIRPNVSREKLDRELTQIAENSCYYFFQSQLRYSFLSTERWTPLVLFATGVTLSGLLVAAVSRFRFKGVESRAAAYRAGYFVLKSSAALALVFVAGLEWSRSQSAILFGSRDPASGPFLLWLYILVSMGVWWWAVADQRARCRECLRLLCFPVRIGCPGHVLLDWSGTEFLCSQGHGVLHVPDLETSWDEPDKHWISLDQSWKDLFADVR
ncbi:MAG: hypothetical protein JO061_14875 [Acidobacteriaceae bacterium]|nr:hypothetical protein [Acidobacteriaceae bacterium]